MTISLGSTWPRPNQSCRDSFGAGSGVGQKRRFGFGRPETRQGGPRKGREGREAHRPGRCRKRRWDCRFRPAQARLPWRFAGCVVRSFGEGEGVAKNSSGTAAGSVGGRRAAEQQGSRTAGQQEQQALDKAGRDGAEHQLMGGCQPRSSAATVKVATIKPRVVDRARSM